MIHAEHDSTYGSPRITAELRDQGLRVNHKRIERVMRAPGIAGLRLRRKVRTTVPDPDATPVPDLLRRDFTATAPGRRYVGEFLYLATVLDLGSRGNRPHSHMAIVTRKMGSKPWDLFYTHHGAGPMIDKPVWTTMKADNSLRIGCAGVSR